MNHDLAIDQNPKTVSELRAIFSAYLNDLFAFLHDQRSREFPAPVLQYALGLEDRLRRIVDRFFDQLDRLADLCVFPHGEVWAPATLNILVSAQKILCSAMLADLNLHADDTLTADSNLIGLADLIQREANASCFFYTTSSAQQPAPDLSALADPEHDLSVLEDKPEHDLQNRKRWPASREHDPHAAPTSIVAKAAISATIP